MRYLYEQIKVLEETLSAADRQRLQAVFEPEVVGKQIED